MMRRSIPKSTTKRLYEMHAQVCKVLANAKRIEVIDLLREGEKTAGELIEKMGISKANLSQQLAVMLGKGVLTARRRGRSVSYRLAYPGMLKAYDMLPCPARSAGGSSRARRALARRPTTYGRSPMKVLCMDARALHRAPESANQTRNSPKQTR